MPENLTYRQLADLINALPEANKDDNVSILHGDDVFPIASTGKSENTDHCPVFGVLDENHFYLVTA